MPELPEITAYVRALEQRVLGQVVETVRVRTPSLLRTFDPRASELEGRRLTAVRRMGKRIVFELEEKFFAVIHLMIAGRLWWRERGATIPKKRGHAAFDFPNGTLLLTEASTHKRASLHVIRGEEALAALDPGGVEPLEVDFHAFRDLEEESKGYYRPSPGSVYPTLQMLEDEGYVTVEEQDGKKIYTITDEGVAERGRVGRRGSGRRRIRPRPSQAILFDISTQPGGKFVELQRVSLLL